MKWMALPDEYAKDNAKTVIIPIKYEKDATYGKGASKGSAAIIKASQYLEYYDDELDAEPFETGIRIADCVEPKKAQDIERAVSKESDRFVIVLGGDHSVSIESVKALAQKHENLSVLMLDAHADLRYSWNQSVHSHACVGRRIAEEHNIAVVGVRAMDIDEKEFAEKSKNVMLIKACEYDEAAIHRILDHLTENVYISIDVDVFDPAFIRNTGTPEPGGLWWYQALRLLKKVCEKKNVVGGDVVEFAPSENYRAEAFSLAKLVYKLIAYKQMRR